MLKIKTTIQFEKDLRLMKKRSKNLSKIEVIVDKLSTNVKLPIKNKDHKLVNYNDYRECHIEPDWLLIYYKDIKELNLIRTGTHSDLFK